MTLSARNMDTPYAQPGNRGSLDTIRGVAKEAVRTGLYHGGGFGLWHRWRNQATLTVLMFHRVIDPSSPAWPRANTLFTLSPAFFDRLLGFVRRHYAPVTLAEAHAGLAGTSSLPPRALLVSFDDGWGDNADIAAPALKRHGVPAVFFLATGAVETGEAFAPERFHAAAMGTVIRNGGDLPDRLLDLLSSHGLSTVEEQLPLSARLMMLFERLVADGQLESALERLDPQMDDFPKMMTPGQVSAMADDPLFDFGTHGVSHTPLTVAEDIPGELGRSWEMLSGWCDPPVKSLSFPHGLHNDAIVSMAKEMGYERLFSSKQVLTPVGFPYHAPVGRFEVRAPGSDPFRPGYDPAMAERFDGPRIASEMFLRPHAQGHAGDCS